MVEVRPDIKNPGLWALALVLLLLAGCAQPGVEFGPDRVRHRNLLAAQQADPMKQTERSAANAGEKLREGDRLRRSGSDQRALFRYLEAHRIDPTNPSARERIAFIHLDEEPERSRSIFEEVLEENPSSEIAHLGLGLAELGLGNLNAARASLETARSLAPASPEVLTALGSVYDRLGLREQARAELTRARDLRPRDPRILNNLGVSYLLAEDPASAERLLREAVLRDPHDLAARNNLGLALGLLGRYQDALASFREAGSEQAAQNNLGYCYFLTDRFEDAVFHYEKALMAEGPDDLTVLGNLAAARAEQARPREPAANPSEATPLTLTLEASASAAEGADAEEPIEPSGEPNGEPAEQASATPSEEPIPEPAEQASAQPAGEPEPAAAAAE